MNIKNPFIELMMWEEDKFVSAHAFIAFLRYFWMGDIEVVRWNGVDFLVPKHLRKSKIGLLEQIWAKNPYVTFFLGHPVDFNYVVLTLALQSCESDNKKY